MKHSTCVAVVSMLLLGCASSLLAADGAEETREKIAPKAEKVRRATAVDFNYEMDLTFEALEQLGERIEASRKAADPVGLAASAQLLQTAEKVAKKKASLTSEQLQTEAIKLAKLRQVPNELDAVALSTGNTELTELATRIRETAPEPDEKQRDLHGELHVHNHSHEGFNVYANGYHLGYVGPHGEREWHVQDIHYVDAINNYHRLHQHIEGHVHHYDFYLHVHHGH